MNVIAVLSEKGGVGKTTVTLELAAAAGRLGKVSAVFDLDPQATASSWSDRRKAETPQVVAVPASRLQQGLAKAKTLGIDLAVIDTRGLALEAMEGARRADLVVVPVQPNITSLETVSRIGDLLRAAGNPPSAFVVNLAPIQGGDGAAAIEYLAGQGLIVVPVILHARATHRHAINTGKVAAEVEAHSKAAEEVNQFTSVIFEIVKRTEESLNGKN